MPYALLALPLQLLAYLGFDRWFETRFFGFRAYSHWTTNGFDAWVARPEVLDELRAAVKRRPKRD